MLLEVDQGQELVIAAEVWLQEQAKAAERRKPPPSLLAWLETARPTVHDQPYGKEGITAPLRAIYADRSPEVVVAKAAQVGISEWLISTALWCADTRQGGRGNALYVFPTIGDVYDFVRARVDSAVEASSYLDSRVRPRRGLVPVGKLADNVGLKRIGDGFVYFRGSNAKAGLRAIDADLVIYDEVDRLASTALALGAERLGSSLLGWQRYASTPIYPELGIDALWLRSTRNRWHVTCPACNCEQALAFPDNLREDGQVICRTCHLPLLPPWLAGRWLPENPDAGMVGYHVDKFLSPRANLKTLAETGYRILRRDETDPSKIQEFYNQGLGVPHAPEGGQLSRADLAACVGNYSLDEHAPTGCTMGVDVGAKLHVVVGTPGPEGKQRFAFIGTVPGFADLDALMARFDVSACVVDSEPEHHSARQFANRHQGRVWLCRYPNTQGWSYQEPVRWTDDEQIVSAHRTITLDSAFAAIRERRVELPRETQYIPEFFEQMMAPVRVLEKDRQGNSVARYVEGGQADHFAHTFNYLCIAGMRPEAPVEQVIVYEDRVTIGDESAGRW